MSSRSSRRPNAPPVPRTRSVCPVHEASQKQSTRALLLCLRGSARPLPSRGGDSGGLSVGDMSCSQRRDADCRKRCGMRTTNAVSGQPAHELESGAAAARSNKSCRSVRHGFVMSVSTMAKGWSDSDTQLRVSVCEGRILKLSLHADPPRESFGVAATAAEQERRMRRDVLLSCGPLLQSRRTRADEAIGAAPKSRSCSRGQMRRP